MNESWKEAQGCLHCRRDPVTPLESRDAVFSNPCYISLVITKTDHLRWRYRRICCCWQLTRTQLSIQVHWYSYSLYWKKIISSSTLGHCFCRPGICYFIPTCWYNISSLNRHQAMKSSEEHYCSVNCFLALYCLVIVRWIARLAQAHSVCVRNRKGDFSPCFSYQLFLTSPFASYKRKVFVNVILSGNSKGRTTDSSPKWNHCFFLPSHCQIRASDATGQRGQQLAGSWKSTEVGSSWMFYITN